MSKYVEHWKQIKDFPEYEISSFGNIKNKDSNKLLKQSIDSNGYEVVSLYSDSIKKQKPIHRLVAGAFIPNPKDKICVDHIDRNRKNNNESNLRWATNQENSYNASMKKNNTSGHIGVYYRNGRGKWAAQIRIHGKVTHLGDYDTCKEGSDAYQAKAKELFGKFHQTQDI